ncbi:MAG: S-ribosylhomocysteine lyase [Trueperaceae bacterium]
MTTNAARHEGPRTQVASFDLDHTRVRAPYVRLAGRHDGPLGDRVSKWDLRLVQPNQAEIPTAALHTIEHLLAGYLRDALDDAGFAADGGELVDASPMGCRTGFYLTMLGEPDPETMRAACRHALAAIAEHDGEIPGCAPERCGNWRDHSLPGANAWARAILEHEMIVQETIPLR